MGGMPPRNFEFAFSPERERERGKERELPEKEIGVKGYRVVSLPSTFNAVFIRKQHPVHFPRDKNILRDLVPCECFQLVAGIFTWKVRVGEFSRQV